MSETESDSIGEKFDEEALLKKTNDGLENGTIIPIMLGQDILYYQELNPDDPDTSIEPYQKLKGYQGLAKLLMDMTEDPEEIARQKRTLQDVEIAFEQMRGIIPDIDARNAAYEKQCDILHENWKYPE